MRTRSSPRIGSPQRILVEEDKPMEKIYTHWILLDPSAKNIAWANKAFKRGARYAINRIYMHPSGVDSVLEIISPDDWQHLQLDVESFSSPLRRTARKPSPLGKGSEVERWEKIYGKLKAPRVRNGEVVFPR